jgi:hypothetical protein
MDNESRVFDNELSIRQDRIKKSLLVYVALFNAMLIIGLLRLSYNGISWLEFSSFLTSDVPWLPDQVVHQPIYGVHYFGDFYLPFRFVTEANPYSPVQPYNLILPFGQITFQALGFLSPGWAYLVFLVSTFLTLFLALNYILSISNKLDKFHKRIIALLLILLSFPIITAVDRGAYVLLVASAFAWLTGYLIKNTLGEKEVFFVALVLSFLISAKVYLLPFLVIIWFFKSRKLTVLTFGLFILSNALCSYFFGGPNVVIGQLSHAFLVGSGSTGIEILFKSQSFSGLTANIVSATGIQLDERFFVFTISYLPGFVFLLATVFIGKMRKLPFEFVMIFAMSFFQYLAPVSYVYTGVWATVSAALLINYYIGKSKAEEERVLLVVAIGVLSQLLPFHVYENYRVVIPTCWVLSVIIAFVMLVRQERGNLEKSFKL